MAGKPFADPPSYGKAYDSFEDKAFAKNVCEALSHLAECDSIRTISNTFLGSLPGMADEHGRVHTSLNINTETGRLSSQRPNLQNQPALEKDTYGVSFVCVCMHVRTHTRTRLFSLNLSVPPNLSASFSEYLILFLFLLEAADEHVHE